MRLIRSFGYACAGVKYCYIKEPNFRIHVLFTAISLTAGLYFHISMTEWIIVASCIGIVLSLEMINTAIEKLCDIVSPERKPAIMIIKDVSAGAVFMAALASCAIGTIIFLPKIILLLKSLK